LGAETCDPDPEGLAEFIRNKVLPACESATKEFGHREAVRLKTLGEGLQPHRLENLCRYEVNLDGKFERTLGTVVKLKELGSAPTASQNEATRNRSCVTREGRGGDPPRTLEGKARLSRNPWQGGERRALRRQARPLPEMGGICGPRSEPTFRLTRMQEPRRSAVPQVTGGRL
jgi:hypothetical protein